MFSRSSQWWQAILLLVPLLFIPVAAWSYFEGPVEVCELATLSVSVDIAGQLIDIEFPDVEPIEVDPDEFVIITAKIETRPEGCKGIFSGILLVRKQED